MDEDIDSINVVPLVDVMLVLLTIVLTTATFVVTGRIPVDLAKASHAAPVSEVAVVLTLTRDRKLFLNDEPVFELVQAMAAFRPDQSVTIRADGGLALAEFVSLVDRVKSLGFQRVTLEVKRS